MSDIFILAVLKFAGLAIGLTSTVWSMKHELKVDDGQGGKRLTPQGHRIIALALGGFLVAASSQGFETLAKQAELRNKAISDEVKAAQDFRNEQRAKRSLDLQILNRAEALNQAAVARAARAEQRFLLLRASNEQRVRDLALSREVNEGSQQNLQRAGVALAQLERVLQPIETIRFSVTWEIPLGSEMPALSALARRAQQDPSLVSRPEFDAAGLASFEVNYYHGPEFYPRSNSNFEVHEVVAAFTRVSLFAQASALANGPQDHGLRDRGDIRFGLRSRRPDRSSPILRYQVRSNSLIVRAEVSEAEITFRSGNIVSIIDFRRSALAMETEDPPSPRPPHDAALLALLRQNMRPIRAELSASGHTFALDSRQFRRVQRRNRAPLFMAVLRRQGD